MPKHLVAAAALLALTSACAASAPALRVGGTPESHRASAEEFLDGMNLEKVMTVTIETTLQAQMAADPKLADYREVMTEFLQTHMGYKTLRPDFARIYMEAFTERELREMTAFYKTETGQKALNKMPELLQKGAALGQKRVQENAADLMERVKARALQLQSQPKSN